MKLNTKILLSGLLIWVLFLGLSYFGSRHFLLRNYLALEENQTEKDLARLDEALASNKQSLYTFSADWGHWSDLYAFMQGTNPRFIDNLDMTAFSTSNINFLTYWNKKNEIVVGGAIDLDNKQFIAYPKEIVNYIYPGSLLLDRKDVNLDLTGYILLPNGIMMVASVSITNGSKSLPPLGVFITGRYISNEVILNIRNTSQLNAVLMTANQININKKFKSIFEKVNSTTNGHYFYRVNSNQLKGYTLIRDIYGAPIGMFAITEERSIYQSGLLSVKYFLYAYILLALFFSIILFFLLRWLIVKRLERLSMDVKNIGENNDLLKRVDDQGTDELSFVSKRINELLTQVQGSQELLEKKVDDRTKALKQTNVELQREINERKTIERDLLIHKEYLAKLAHYDTLTSLPNRIYFNDMLDKMLKEALAHGYRLAVMFIDLDRFKPINDARGHQIGDVVLKEVANRINTIMRKGDVLARLGGDEFIVLLNNIDSKDFTTHVAQRILKTLAEPVVVNHQDFYVTASVGICIFPEDGTSLEDLQRNADMAMYKAKRSGGDVYRYFTKEMTFDANERIQLESDMRRGLSNNEFILHYQPKYLIKSAKITGVEALIRWNHKEHGFISPGRFIPHAEESGLILQIGEWVMQKACEACKDWQNKGYKNLSVAVNISAKQFCQQNIVNIIRRVLDDTSLAPALLEVEITESAVMGSIESAIAKINQIREMGVKVSIDDFGSGYASISYLKSFNVDALKIDQTYIKGVPSQQNDIAITLAIIQLAHRLGIEVIAEGVETSEQLKWLTENNCDMVQGYFLSRPLPEENLLIELSAIHK